MEEYYDVEITCSCGKEFTWTAGEQRFMNQLLEEGKIDVVNKPKRCPSCRADKKKRFEGRDQR